MFSVLPSPRPLYVLVEAVDERGRLYEEWTTALPWYGPDYAERLADRLLELGCVDIHASVYGGDPILALPIGEFRRFAKRRTPTRYDLSRGERILGHITDGVTRDEP
jgi:hypothetical protein